MDTQPIAQSASYQPGTRAAPSLVMKFTGSALAITVAIIVALWLAGQALGFHVSLLHSLALSVGLTILINLVLAALSRRPRR